MKARKWTELEDTSLVHGYCSRENIEAMAKRLNIGRSSIYRRLAYLGIPARVPRKRSGSGISLIKNYKHADPLVKELFNKARKEYASLTWLATRSGLCRETIGGWGNGSSPIAANLNAVGNCIGLKLVWKKIDEDS